MARFDRLSLEARCLQAWHSVTVSTGLFAYGSVLFIYMVKNSTIKICFICGSKYLNLNRSCWKLSLQSNFGGGPNQHCSCVLEKLCKFQKIQILIWFNPQRHPAVKNSDLFKCLTMFEPLIMSMCFKNSRKVARLGTGVHHHGLWRWFPWQCWCIWLFIVHVFCCCCCSWRIS